MGYNPMSWWTYYWIHADYNHCKAANKTAMCYILGFMNNILQQQHCGIETIADIMFSIEEMFANLRHWPKMKKLLLSWIFNKVRGTPISQHMMKIIV